MKKKRSRSAAKKAAEQIKNIEPENPSDLELEDDPLSFEGQRIPPLDTDEAELEYDGYRSIEQYDGDELNANVDDQPDDGKELEFMERPTEQSIAEEDMTDKQDHRKTSSI